MISATLLGQSVLSGLFSGCLYALLGLGLTLSWRYLRIINLAHFALIFLAAYLAYWMNSAYGFHPLMTCLALIPAFFALGVAQQLLFIRFKVGEFASVIVTFGLTIIVESLIQFIWSADFVRMETHLARGSLEIGKLLAPWDELFMCAVALSVCVATWACLNFTWLGKALRASLDNPDIAASFGVPNRALALLVSGAAASFAAIGGVFVALLAVGLPFVVRAVQPILEDMDVAMEEAARTLGATPWQAFLRVVLPSLTGALLTGFALAFARGAGEYGSVIFIAGNMPGVSEIAPLVIVTRLEQYDYAGAAAVGLAMLAISLLALVAINAVQGVLARRVGR